MMEPNSNSDGLSGERDKVDLPCLSEGRRQDSEAC